MWKLYGHPKTQQVTKDLALKFANMDPAPQDRPMSELRLQVYEKIMRSGGFRPMSWAAAYCTETAGTYRVNGKHTSTLCASGLLAELPPLFAIVEYYNCDTLEDVSRLYATYDSKMMSRSTADINRSFAACVPQLEEVDHQTVNLCAAAIWFSSLQTMYTRIQPAERAEVLFEHHDFVVWCAGVCGRNNSSYLKRMPVVAAMYSTWNRAPRVADQFWKLVRDETATTPEDPTRKLGKFLAVNAGRSRVRDGVMVRRIKEREYFCRCLTAWNAFRDGVATALKYYPNAEIPAVK